LDKKESAIYSLLLRMAFEGHQTYFIQQLRRLVGTEIWQYWSRDMDSFFKHRGVINWWSRNGERFDPAFQEYINKKIPANIPGDD